MTGQEHPKQWISLGSSMTMGRFRRFVSLEVAAVANQPLNLGIHTYYILLWIFMCMHNYMNICPYIISSMFNLYFYHLCLWGSFCRTGKRSEFWIRFKHASRRSSCPHLNLRRKPSIVLHSQAPLVGFKAPVAQSIWVWRYLKPCIDKPWWNHIEMTQQPALVMHRHLPGFHW